MSPRTACQRYLLRPLNVSFRSKYWNYKITNSQCSQIRYVRLKILLPLLNFSLLTSHLSLAGTTALKTLNVSANKLTELPDSLVQTSTALVTLYLSRNKLIHLPEDIGIFLLLTQSNQESNLMISLNGDIGKLSSLQRLNISMNEIAHLPTSIGNLAHLEELFASQNKLQVLPR